MKQFFFGLSIGLIITACAMGGKSARLKTPVDESKSVWEFCTPKMIADYKGKACLIKCAEKLKSDGSCKGDKYQYIAKDLKAEHDFFMDKFIIIPESYYY